MNDILLARIGEVRTCTTTLGIDAVKGDTGPGTEQNDKRRDLFQFLNVLAYKAYKLPHSMIIFWIS